MSIPVCYYFIESLIGAVDSEPPQQRPPVTRAEPIHVALGIGGVLHQVEQRHAARDQAEGTVSRRSEVAQEFAQDAALGETILVALLVLHHLESIENE